MKKIFLSLVIVFLTACSDDPTTTEGIEPSDVTCNSDYIRSLDSIEDRQELSAKCARRGKVRKSEDKGFTLY